MNISLQIDCESVEEYFDTLQKLMGSTSLPAASSEPNTGNVVALSGKRKPKLSVETKSTKPTDEAPIDPQEDALGADEPTQETVDKLAENLEPDEDFSEATAEPEAPSVALTQANTRKFAIRFVNACHTGDAAKDTSLQGKRKEEFAALLKVFGVSKFTEIAAEQWPAVVEYINAERAKRKLPADEVKEADVD